MNLSDIRPGDTVVITGYKDFAPLRRRLEDMGFIAGTKVSCVSRSPLGDPYAYLVRRTLLALRREDAGQILVREVER